MKGEKMPEKHPKPIDKTVHLRYTRHVQFRGLNGERPWLKLEKKTMKHENEYPIRSMSGTARTPDKRVFYIYQNMQISRNYAKPNNIRTSARDAVITAYDEVREHFYQLSASNLKSWNEFAEKKWKLQGRKGMRKSAFDWYIGVAYPCYVATGSHTNTAPTSVTMEQSTFENIAIRRVGAFDDTRVSFDLINRTSPTINLYIRIAPPHQMEERKYRLWEYRSLFTPPGPASYEIAIASGHHSIQSPIAPYYPQVGDYTKLMFQTYSIEWVPGVCYISDGIRITN